MFLKLRVTIKERITLAEEKKSDLAVGESVSKAPKNSATAWIVAIFVLLAGVAVVMCSKKLNPCMTALIEGLGVDTVYTCLLYTSRCV